MLLNVILQRLFYMYYQLDRHMRRLDQDLSRFTIELEADTAGITELLEQRTYVTIIFTVML